MKEEDYNDFVKEFVESTKNKVVEIIKDELEIDAGSLFDWFLDTAIMRDFNEAEMRNFSKIFAQIFFIDMMKEKGLIIDMETPEKMEELKNIAKKLKKED
jgi:hypothetical protein